MITGQDLINFGYEPGPYFKDMLEEANKSGKIDKEVLDQYLPPPVLPLTSTKSWTANIDPVGTDEVENWSKVRETMNEIMRTPVVKHGAIMPDACPAGPVGTIPVGGVVSSEHIHPGMHSADICCSVMLTNFGQVDPKMVLDSVHKTTHFGWGGRHDVTITNQLAKKIRENQFTYDLIDTAVFHIGTQGDGNHFAYVGILESTGDTCLVTHHGSRGFGAQLYKKAMRVAETYRKRLSPETLKQNAWIPHDTQDGEDYWNALKIVRDWTKQNHQMIVHLVSCDIDVDIYDQFWNEHNFVFMKSDGLFYHGKGATPAWDGWAWDASPYTLIPLNMAQPVLITRGRNNPDALGFSPHGAGRNFSRSEHRRRGLGNIFEETEGLDIRFYSGNPDPSELPSGYKNAEEIIKQIHHFRLADVVDKVLPYGCIMAGDIEKDAPWRKKD